MCAIKVISFKYNTTIFLFSIKNHLILLKILQNTNKSNHNISRRYKILNSELNNLNTNRINELNNLNINNKIIVTINEAQ